LECAKQYAFEGKLESNLSSLCVLSRAGGRGIHSKPWSSD